MTASVNSSHYMGLDEYLSEHKYTCECGCSMMEVLKNGSICCAKCSAWLNPEAMHVVLERLIKNVSYRDFMNTALLNYLESYASWRNSVKKDGDS